MAQASFWQKQSIDFARRLADLQLERRVPRSLNRFLPVLRGSQRWLFVVLGLTFLIFWDWKLLLATALGIGAMLGVYALQQGGWQVYRAQLERFFRSSQRSFTVAAGSGGLAALFAYAAAAMWTESENRWLAAGAVFQGIGTLLTLLLLGWQIGTHREGDWENQFDRFLADLTDSDPLKRAIAMRQLTRMALKGKLNVSDREIFLEYLHLLLARETHTVARNAALESLQRLEASRQRQFDRTPERAPLKLERFSRIPERRG